MKELIVLTKEEYKSFEEQVCKRTAEKIFAFLADSIERTDDLRNNGTLFFVSDYNMVNIKKQIKIEFGIDL